MPGRPMAIASTGPRPAAGGPGGAGVPAEDAVRDVREAYPNAHLAGEERERFQRPSVQHSASSNMGAAPKQAVQSTYRVVVAARLSRVTEKGKTRIERDDKRAQKWAAHVT